MLGEVRPALELGVRWLAGRTPPGGPAVTVHGDYRLGNFLVGPDGLRGVLDWELAHAGDPAEDVGWLCAPAWRFGGSGEVGGFGALGELVAAYTAAGGAAGMTPERVHWWQVYATVKWAAICALQASAHLSGATRSVELAAIGRRVCESEWDLFVLLGTPPPATAGPVAADGPTPPFGRPTAAELVEAVGEYLRGRDGAQRGRRPLRGACGAQRSRHRRTRAPARPGGQRGARGTPGRSWGSRTTPRWSARCVPARSTEDLASVAPALAASARDQLLVANPSYLPPADPVERGGGRRRCGRGHHVGQAAVWLGLESKRRPPR